jgi:hypothetical protein
VKRARNGRSIRIGFAAALTVALLAALASVGGLSYAATATHQAVTAVKKVVAPKTAKATAAKQGAAQLLTRSAGSDQYRPGFGFGDKNHNHTGPPGLERGSFNPQDNGAFAPPPAGTPLAAALTGDKKAYFIKTEVNIDEQAHLIISVVDAAGVPLVLVQRGLKGGSFVGGPLTGTANVKRILYQVLVPRSVPIVLRIPANVVKPGESYTIRVIAQDPDKNQSELRVPFTIPAA